jgi:hypothetical protein
MMTVHQMASRHKVDDRDWLELVQATKVKDLLAIKPHQTLRGLPVLADKNATIEETLQLLKDNNILSVPVVDMSGCHAGRKVDLDTFDGFVDVLDILAFLLWHMRVHTQLKMRTLRRTQTSDRPRALHRAV